MKSSYIDYAMSVIIGRAIPDVRDGLKPVHRRSLFAMWEMGNTHDKPFKKSARVVGDVMGKYHPHGDTAIYDTIVKMAQPFSYRYTLVEGQGNFGSVDGDAAAAMRYTEIRLSLLSEEILHDIEKETVRFIPNFDGSLKEPVVLPARVPNLLVNGSSGIAVGMATNMPPHNLGEVCQVVSAYIDNPQITVDELLALMPGPDFPTGGMIMGSSGIREAYLNGQGKMTVRGISEIEVGKKGDRILITELPFQVNKARLVEHIAILVKEKRIDGISDLRDESDKEGMRVVIDMRKGAMAEVIQNQLYKHTALETTFGIINLAIVDNQPRYLPLPRLLQHFVEHRVEVIRNRSLFDLKKAQERVHILSGLLLALSRIDDIIITIRASEDAEKAKLALIERFSMDDPQATAILQMQLRRLAALERKKILDEKDTLEKECTRLQILLSDERNIRAEIKRDMEELRERFADARRTRISEAAINLEREDLIEDKPALLSLTSLNYIKRMDLDTYRQQRRGGRGITGMTTREEDVVEHVFIGYTHDYLLCFTNRGRVYWLKVYNVPEGSRTSRGKAIINLLNLKDERVTAVIPIRNFRPDRYLFFATRRGLVMKIAEEEFSHPRPSGINAISLRENDELVDVKMTDGAMEMVLTTEKGQSLRFHEQAVRPHHRNTMGVIGIRLREGDSVQAVTIVQKEHLLTVTESGFGKRTSFDEFRGHGRGTMGVRNIITRGSRVVTAKAVSSDDGIIMMSATGIVMRTRVEEISIQKRNTRGVRVMKLDEGDRLIGMAVIPAELEVDIPEQEILGGDAAPPDQEMPGNEAEPPEESVVSSSPQGPM
ncbi:MAG: DNA gyrase subunit A [Methanomicrobiales archaeon]|nr:DNA gyrase subunit A [Methanomicrobiales archaeon]